MQVYDADYLPLSASAIGNRYAFQGREYSWASGLYYFRARWYDPVTGRWLSKDPIGISGGLNQYVAFGGNPVLFIDPDGLAAMEAYEFWMGWASEGYSQGGFWGGAQAEFGNAMGMFIDMWHARDIQEHAEKSGYFSAIEGCETEAWVHGGAVFGYLALDFVQFAGAAKMVQGIGGPTRVKGKEFSHWIPNRHRGPRAWWNGRVVSPSEHALHDPFRYRFMPRTWKAANPPRPMAVQQLSRLPDWARGASMVGGTLLVD